MDYWKAAYYVFDEAQYAVADSQVNPRTAFWLSQMDQFDGRRRIHVFLTATPEPFQLFYSCLRNNLTVELMQAFLSRYYLDRIDSNGGNPEYWLRYVSERYTQLSEQYDQADEQMGMYLRNYTEQQNPTDWQQYENSRMIRGNIEQQLDAERARILEESRDPLPYPL